MRALFLGAAYVGVTAFLSLCVAAALQRVGRLEQVGKFTGRDS